MEKYMMFEFENALNQLKKEFELICRRNEELTEKIENWSKDSEIQNLEKRINKGYLIPEEIMDKIRDSKEEHFLKSKKCNRQNDVDIIISPTELSDSITCKCRSCGKVLYGGWNG